MNEGYRKDNDIIADLSLRLIEVYDKAEIVFNDGDTRNYETIQYNDSDYIIGEIKSIEYEQWYVKHFLIFLKKRLNKLESKDVFIDTGRIMGDSVKAINCKTKKQIYHLDKNKANPNLYRIKTFAVFNHSR